ncbi:MAG: hypothetical protein J5819_00755 [Eubacterium sp.]|nr:hypothetical protein [Eubacterium sp.]
MKKKIVVVMALAAAMSFGLTACGDGKNDAISDAIDSAAEDVADAIGDVADTFSLDSGSNESDGTSSDSVDMSTAKEETWGVFTISVPTGFEFKTGDTLDEKYEGSCSVKESTFKYFDIDISDKENGMNHYNYNKETYTNEQKDVSGTIGDFSWTGFQYSDGFGGYGFELYTEVGDQVLRISSAGYEFGSAVPEAILATLHVKA